MNQNTVRDDQIVRVAHIARDLAHLPGAATPDWCRQAAGVFVKHEPSTRAWVMVIASGDRPDHRRTEASGYAEGPDRAHDPIAARPAVAVTRAVLEALCRIERPGVLSVAALLEIEPRTRGFTVLRRFPRLLVGITELEPPADETPYPRVMLILWDPPEAAGARGALADTRLVLGSVLPVLGDRLRQALGCRPGCTPWLSECEHRVLNMLTDGLSVPEIAEALGRSPHTVHDHVKRLHAKLGTRSRGALLVRVLGYHPQPPLPVTVARKPRSIAPFREGAFVDHRAW